MSTVSQIYAPKNRIEGVLVAIAVLIIASVAAWISQKGAAAQAALEQQRNNEIAAESHAFCEKWSSPAGTEKHAQCVADLQIVRNNQTKRFEDDIAP